MLWQESFGKRLSDGLQFVTMAYLQRKKNRLLLKVFTGSLEIVREGSEGPSALRGQDENRFLNLHLSYYTNGRSPPLYNKIRCKII